MNTEQLNLIDTVITNLDRLTVRGVSNMGLVIDSINALGRLRELLAKGEVKPDVPVKAE